jgi:hypothetical protein
MRQPVSLYNAIKPCTLGVSNLLSRPTTPIEHTYAAVAALHHHHTRFSTITSPHRSHTSLLASPTNSAPVAPCNPRTVVHSSKLAIPTPQVVRHPFLFVNRSQTPIVGATLDAGGAAPPLT